MSIAEQYECQFQPFLFCQQLMAIHSSPTAFNKAVESLRKEKGKDEDWWSGGGYEGIDEQSEMLAGSP